MEHYLQTSEFNLGVFDHLKSLDLPEFLSRFQDAVRSFRNYIALEIELFTQDGLVNRSYFAHSQNPRGSESQSIGYSDYLWKKFLETFRLVIRDLFLAITQLAEASYFSVKVISNAESLVSLSIPLSKSKSLNFTIDFYTLYGFLFDFKRYSDLNIQIRENDLQEKFQTIFPRVNSKATRELVHFFIFIFCEIGRLINSALPRDSYFNDILPNLVNVLSIPFSTLVYILESEH